MIPIPQMVVVARIRSWSLPIARTAGAGGRELGIVGKQTTPALEQETLAQEQKTPLKKQRVPRGEQTMPAKAGWVGRRGRCRSTAVGQASKPLMLLGVDSSLRCRVVYLKAFNNPSTTLGGCSLRTLMDRFTSMCDVLVNAPCGCTWS